MRKEVLTVIHDEAIDIQEFFSSLPVSIQKHCRAVSAYTGLLLRWAEEENACGEESIPPDAAQAVLYCDIGMALVPERIYNKPDDLTGPERRVLERHTTYGGKLLEDYSRQQKFPAGKREVWQLAAETALSHHERWDGKGYPFGLLATAIPLVVRAASIADSYDSIIRGSPFRMALPPEYAMLEIIENAGTQFDPCLVDIFRRHDNLLQASSIY